SANLNGRSTAPSGTLTGFQAVWKGGSSLLADAKKRPHFASSGNPAASATIHWGYCFSLDSGLGCQGGTLVVLQPAYFAVQYGRGAHDRSVFGALDPASSVECSSIP